MSYTYIYRRKYAANCLIVSSRKDGVQFAETIAYVFVARTALMTPSSAMRSEFARLVSIDARDKQKTQRVTKTVHRPCGI